MFSGRHSAAGHRRIATGRRRDPGGHGPDDQGPDGHGPDRQGPDRQGPDRHGHGPNRRRRQAVDVQPVQNASVQDHVGYTRGHRHGAEGHRARRVVRDERPVRGVRRGSVDDRRHRRDVGGRLKLGEQRGQQRGAGGRRDFRRDQPGHRALHHVPGKRGVQHQ